ncbi:MAG TPA: hypothetical protein VMA95_07215, partial [Streptosporangiaceae bacterium]|nr:hypothetical protein [Streptosporangiaceae bacterium]
SYLVTALHGWQLLTYNLFVLSGIVIFLVMLAVAVPVRRRKPQDPPAPPPQPEQRAPSPLSALLARAETVLKTPESFAARKHQETTPADGCVPSAG